MRIHNINDYRTHIMKHKDHLFYIDNAFSKISDQLKDDNQLQLFNDSIDDIYNSIKISDEYLINVSVLHLTELIRDTKDKKKFNHFSDLDTLKSILTYLIEFELNTELSDSAIEMIAFLSYTNLLEETELLHDDDFFQYIFDSANMMNANSFIILSNFILENEENAKKCYLLFPPQFISDTFYTIDESIFDKDSFQSQFISYSFYNNDESNFDEDNHQSQRDAYLFSVLALLSSYCNYDVDESAAFDILSCIKDLIYFNEKKTIFLNELFYSLSMFRINCQYCAQKASEVNIFECFQKIRCELDPEIKVTIFQYYGDSILHNYQIHDLDIDKLIGYVSSDEKIISGAAMWLIWNIMNDTQSINRGLIQQFYNHEFFILIKSIISLNEFIANVKLALLILCILIENANTDQIFQFITDDFINIIFENDYIESDDQDIVFHIIIALNRLLNHFRSIGRNEFLNFLQSQLNGITPCEISEERFQILAKNCSEIIDCFK